MHTGLSVKERGNDTNLLKWHAEAGLPGFPEPPFEPLWDVLEDAQHHQLHHMWGDRAREPLLGEERPGFTCTKPTISASLQF